MSIPVDIFRPEIEVTSKRVDGAPSFAEEMHKRARNAIAKALKAKPIVRKLLWITDKPLRRYYYSVHGRSVRKSEYLVLLRNDRDGQLFIECSCPAGNPFADENTGVIAWQPKPCYHVAAVLLVFVKTMPANDARRKQKRASV